MNKIIPFTKVITLNERFDEIEKIALDDTLKLEDPLFIKGDLIIRGCYKVLERKEDFSYPIPVEIAIDDKYDTSKCNILIDDFYYEIINEQDLRIKIDIMLDDLFYKENEKETNELVLEDKVFENEIKDEIKNDVKSSNNNRLEKEFLEEIDVKRVDSLSNISLNNDSGDEENHNNVNPIEGILNNENTEKEYSIYRVYVISEGDSLESILEKYKVTKEDLLPFNDLENLTIGKKIIIPAVDE